MKLPVKFKYCTLDKGFVAASKTTELGFEGYILTDDNGVQIAAGTSLGGLVVYAQQLDVTRELAEQVVAQDLPTFKHLEGVDLTSRDSDLALPRHLIDPESRRH